eukprot:487961-Pyramimonas_sp.AAC.1
MARGDYGLEQAPPQAPLQLAAGEHAGPSQALTTTEVTPTSATHTHKYEHTRMHALPGVGSGVGIQIPGSKEGIHPKVVAFMRIMRSASALT